jgi:uncharacterized protein
MPPTEVMLWRRLDTPGHDSCRLEQRQGDWELAGCAVFQHPDGPARLDYRITCDPDWRSQRGEIRGWLGSRAVANDVVRAATGTWTLDGVVMPGLEACLDLDLGFTPATNILHLRRRRLTVGQTADIPVAWLDAGARALVLLPQRYQRRTESTYWYESPTAAYAALLEMAPNGFARRYPGLWEAEG